MTRALPGPMSFVEFERFRLEPSRWIPAALDIARAHGMACVEPEPFADGSNLVVALGDAVLKIFPPMLRHQFEAERGCLSLLDGRLSVPTPRIRAEGERSGWAYLVLDRLAGENGALAWPALDEVAKERLLHSIGALIAEVQRVPVDDLSLAPRWDEFLRQQIAGCRARLERLDVPSFMLEGLDGVLADARALLPLDSAPVLLTGEYIAENFLVRRSGDGAELTALIDFGDAMTGFCEYDLLGPSVFLCGGRPGRIRSLFAGFGHRRDAHLRRRMLALFLLHRFCDPARQLRIDGWQRSRSLDELAQLVWPD